MANARATTELASLHTELLKQTALHTSTTAMAAVPGSRAGSTAAYDEIMAKNGHGRLRRTHMEDVDRLGEAARNELDSYLRRTIHKTAPVGIAFCGINADQVFATLSTFGLRMEDRGPLADVTVFNDGSNLNTATMQRLQNYSRYYYIATTSKYECYWKGSALETLIELARYRGLWDADGFLTAAK